VGPARQDRSRLRYAALTITGIAALTAAVSGCGQQASRTPYSSSNLPASASAARGAPAGSSGKTVSSASGDPGAYNTASGSGQGKGSDLGQGRGSGPGRGKGGQGAAGVSRGTSEQGCPTAGVGGDPVPPPCPATLGTPGQGGIQAPFSATPTTSSQTSGSTGPPPAPCIPVNSTSPARLASAASPTADCSTP
jgi:hypothetical protein